MKKLLKKCPFLILLASMGILLSLIGLGGRNNVYAGQEYDPLKKPFLWAVFTAWRDEIYPWQILNRESTPAMASGEDTAGENLSGEEESAGEKGDSSDAGDGAGEESESVSGNSVSGNTLEDLSGDSQTQSGHADSSGISGARDGGGKGTEMFVSGNMMGEGADGQDSDGGAEQGQGDDRQIPQGRLEPLRESTREEYLNHISADIYGDAGVRRAAEYAFVQVDESYFDDALFIGDSRIVGLRDYTDLSEHADFYCETSLTIQKILKEDFSGKGTIEEALAQKDYGKIYIMSGINELGVGTTEDFMEQYTEVIDTLRAAEPGAKIFIQGIMRVTGKKNSSDAIFNNSNINARNNAIATLADNEQIFYIDVNEVVCDGEGNLNAEYTFDQLHLLGKYNDLWKQFLMAHGAAEQAH